MSRFRHSVHGSRVRCEPDAAAATGWLGLLAVLQALLADESPRGGQAVRAGSPGSGNRGDHE